MSGHNYTNNSANLFDEDELDDDIDDETFLKKKSTNPFLSNSPTEHQIYETMKKEVEERTINSSYRSIGLLRETEQVGISTAEELSRQREQLENTSKQLDDIGTTLRFSQKHLNGLKSVFGGLKNYLSGKDNMQPSRRMTSAQSTLATDSDAARDRDSMASKQSNKYEDNYNNGDSAIGGIDTNISHQRTRSNESKTFNQRLDQNLDEMAGSLSRLKGLAIDLNQEIETQNDLIDNIGNKVENVDVKIKRQNKDMNHLLGRK